MWVALRAGAKTWRTWASAISIPQCRPRAMAVHGACSRPHARVTGAICTSLRHRAQVRRLNSNRLNLLKRPVDDHVGFRHIAPEQRRHGSYKPAPELEGSGAFVLGVDRNHPRTIFPAIGINRNGPRLTEGQVPSAQRANSQVAPKGLADRHNPIALTGDQPFVRLCHQP